MESKKFESGNTAETQKNYDEVVIHAPAGSHVTIETPEDLSKQKEEVYDELGQAYAEEYEGNLSANPVREAQKEILPPKQKGSLLKKWMMTLGFIGATATGMAKPAENNPADSLGKKQGIENVSTSKEKISDQVKGDWNDFLKWLKNKGMQGKEELDHNNLGYQLLEQYIAEHPGTTLSTEILKSINASYGKLREHRLQQIREGKLILEKGVTEENFMKWVVENNKTEHPEYPGSNFTRQEFPEDFELIIDMGAVDHNAIANAAMNEKALGGKMNNMTMADQKVQKKVSKGFAQVGPDYSKKTNTVTLPGADIARGNK